MRVNHGSGDIRVAEEFLDGADILAGFEQVSGEAMSEGVAGNFFHDTGTFCGGFNSGLDGVFVDMVSAELSTVRMGDELSGVIFVGFAGVGVDGQVGSGEEVLPAEFSSGEGPFDGEGVGEPYPTSSDEQILLVQLGDELDLELEIGNEALGERYGSVFFPFGLAHDDLFSLEVDILNA